MKDTMTLQNKTTPTGTRQRSLRRHRRPGRATEMVLGLATGAALVVGGSPATAETLNWNGGGGAPATPQGGSGTWDAGVTSNWASGGAADSWDDSDDAVFLGPPGYTVTIDDSSGAVIATTLTFNTSNVTIDGDGLQINSGITFGATVETATIDSATSGGFQLTTATSAQTLDLNGAITGAFTNASRGRVNIGGISNGAITNSSFGILNITSSVGGSLTQSGPTGTTNVQTGGVVVGATTIDAGLLTVTGTGALQGPTTVNAGGVLDQNSGSTGTVTINGGEFQLGGGSVATVDLQSGELNVRGGGSNALAGSTINVAGGNLGDNFDAFGGSTVNVTGGSVGDNFDAFSGSTVNVAGGSVGDNFDALAGSTVTVSGGQFQVNGSAINDLADGFGAGSPNTDLFTGVLADGSVFIFAGEAFDDFAAGTTSLQTVAVAPSANPGVLSAGTFTQGVRAGETLTVNGTAALGDHFSVVGGTLNLDGGSAGDGLEVAFGEVNVTGGSVGDNFDVFSGSTVNVAGGSVGDAFDANSGSTVNVTGGNVGDGFDANSGSTVNVTGGNVGDGFNARSGSTVNIAGGSVGDFFSASGGSTVNVTGGSVGDNFDAFSGSTVNVAGGSVGDNFNAFFRSTVNIAGGSVGLNFDAFSGSTVNLFGTEFTLDGVLLTGLVLDEAFTITDRDVTLSGLLADGSAFAFDLNAVRVSGQDFFDPGATLTVTLVPEPGSLVLLGLGALLTSRRRRA